ncbi:MAG: hypothetical protein HUJ77_14700, partial [Clostridium sp.]|uniref:collagen binding domain-containing protein n=1 Tax=Clostridium sp. TaxID=1506 RepID=UPI0025C0AA65
MKRSKKITFFILISLILQLFYGINSTNIVKAEENTNFKFITSIQLTDFQGQPLKEDIDKSSEVRVNFNFEIPNTKDLKKGDTFKVKIPNQIELISDFTEDLFDEEKELVAKAHFNKSGEINIEFTDYTGDYSNVKGNFYLETKFDRNNIGNGEIERIPFELSGQSEPVIVEIKFKQDPIPEASIEKTGKYDGSKNEITWNIEFNKENVNVINPKIIDNIPLGQEYIQGTATIDNGADKNGFSYVAAENDSTNSGTLTYGFNQEVNKKYTITFKTRISDINILPKEQGQTVKLTNKAIVNYNNINKESKEASVDVKTNYIEKSASYDANEKKINWTIKVNNNSLSLQNLRVEDVIPEGLEFVKDSFKVNNILNNTYQYNEVNKTLDYTFVGTINTQQIITFSTKVVNEKAYQINGTTNFKNTATIEEGIEGKPYASYTVGVGSNILRKSYKDKYDTSKHYLTWQIEVNSNEVELKNPVVKDEIPVGQKYVEGSFKIEGEGPDTNKFKYEVASEGDLIKTGTITYNFKDTINKKYIITFQTEVTDSSVYAGNVYKKKYMNTSTMTADNISNEVSSKAEQEVTSNVIDKKAESYDAVNKTITWRIFVNNNKTKLGQVVVTDNIPLGQEYVEDSAGINNNADNSLFNYKKADANDTEKTGTLTYNFNKEIDDVYEITFKTKIIDNSIFYTNGQKKVKNTASISGDVIPSRVSVTAEKPINNTVISKAANYQLGNDYIDWNVIINSNSIPMGKVILEDNLQEGLELDTATVELYNQTLNSDGKLIKGEAVKLDKNSVQYDTNTRKFIFNFSNEVDKPYLLTFRTNVIDKNKQSFSNTIQFKGGNGKEESTSNNIKVEFQSGGGSAIGTRGSITVLKVDKDNKTLKGAKFNLIDRYDNVIATGETNEKGELKFNKIKFDIPYTVKEVVAPEGYILNQNNIYEFTINSADDNKNISYTFENEIIKGSLQINKFNEDNVPLEGAEFTVYDSSDKEIKSAVTDKKGLVKFENLVYGSYYYVETKAPEGYILNSDKYAFEIKDNGVVL